jgi:hypothetical protein
MFFDEASERGILFSIKIHRRSQRAKSSDYILSNREIVINLGSAAHQHYAIQGKFSNL